MVTITIEFEYEGKKHNLKAMLTNDLSGLSKSKKNDATEIIDDYGDEDRWSIIFGEYELYVEVVMYRDSDDGSKTTSVDYAIIWNGDIIEAEIDVKSGVKYS